MWNKIKRPSIVQYKITAKYEEIRHNEGAKMLEECKTSVEKYKISIKK